MLPDAPQISLMCHLRHLLQMYILYLSKDGLRIISPRRLATELFCGRAGDRGVKGVPSSEAPRGSRGSWLDPKAFARVTNEAWAETKEAHGECKRQGVRETGHVEHQGVQGQPFCVLGTVEEGPSSVTEMVSTHQAWQSEAETQTGQPQPPQANVYTQTDLPRIEREAQTFSSRELQSLEVPQGHEGRGRCHVRKCA